MRATISGRTQDGREFSLTHDAEPKEIASGVHKGEVKERDLPEFLQHIGQSVLRATEPLPGSDRSEFAEITISVTY